MKACCASLLILKFGCFIVSFYRINFGLYISLTVVHHQGAANLLYMGVDQICRSIQIE